MTAENPGTGTLSYPIAGVRTWDCSRALRWLLGVGFKFLYTYTYIYIHNVQYIHRTVTTLFLIILRNGKGLAKRKPWHECGLRILFSPVVDTSALKINVTWGLGACSGCQVHLFMDSSNVIFFPSSVVPPDPSPTICLTCLAVGDVVKIMGRCRLTESGKAFSLKRLRWEMIKSFPS